MNITKLLKIESSKDRSYAIQRIYYNEMSPITYISASVLDKNKKRVRKIKKKEITDYSTITEYLYSDSRYKEIRAFSENYPYYIELKYRKEFQEFLSFPTWLPQERNISCIYSTYSLTIPEGYKIHYRFYNFKPSETVTTNKDGTTTYVWNTGNLFPVNTAELFSPPLRKVVPYGRIIPDSFVFDDKRGYMNRWSDLGNWISELIEGLDKLPEEEINKIKKLTDSSHSEKEKVKILYKYLQNNTRYIGIFEGTGGLKPYDANYVCNSKYGDCKALTNYMKALLKAADIKSFYCVINAGDKNPPIDTGFVANQFNHAVLMVLPSLTDTIWLECTSQEIPFAYLGTFTRGKYALVCNYKNSFLTKTPEGQCNNTPLTLTAFATINNDSLLFNTTRLIKGKEFEYINHFIKTKDSSKLIKAFYNMLPYANFTVTEVAYQTKPDCTGSLIEQSAIAVKNHLQHFNNTIIIKPFFKLLPLNHTLEANRENPVFISKNISNTDSITYLIPGNYQVDFVPKDTLLTSPFGRYKQSYIVSDSTLVEIKKFSLYKNSYPKDNYPDFRKFLNEIYKLESQNILFKKP